MTSSLPTSECVFAEELLLEGYGGPSAHYVRDQARGVVRAVHAGAAIAPDDTDKLVDLLGDPQAFINEPTEPAHLRGDNRHNITKALLIHACRTDDPDLVRRLRQVAPSEVHRIDFRLPLSVPCLLALFDGLGQEDLAVRHSAMHMVRNIHRHTDITPILDTVISELASLSTAAATIGSPQPTVHAGRCSPTASTPTTSTACTSGSRRRSTRLRRPRTRCARWPPCTRLPNNSTG